MQQVIVFTDNDGTLQICSNQEVVLLLKCESRVRKLGVIAKDTKTKILSYYKNEKEKDTFRKNNSWSINWNLLNWLNEGASINIKSETCIYRITKKQALVCGSFLWFKTSGVERKFYIPKDDFKIEQLETESQKVKE